MVAKVISVAAALIERDGMYLIGRRRDDGTLGGYWEFPGGKIESGESPEQCVVRECREELGIEIISCGLFYETEYTYETENFSVHLYFYKARLSEEIPQTKVHTCLVWVTPQQFSEYSFCPANSGVLKKITQEYNKGNGDF